MWKYNNIYIVIYDVDNKCQGVFFVKVFVEENV